MNKPSNIFPELPNPFGIINLELKYVHLCIYTFKLCASLKAKRSHKAQPRVLFEILFAKVKLD